MQMKKRYLGVIMALIGLCLLPAVVQAYTTTTYSVNATYTVPANVTKIFVQAWGGGGAGANQAANSNRAGGGGGGGGYAEGFLTVSAGQNWTVQVAATISPNGTAGANGNHGWLSSVNRSGANVTAGGGEGGLAGAGATPAGGTGNKTGGNGGDAGTVVGFGSGGGGGGAGTFQYGGNGTAGTSGVAGVGGYGGNNSGGAGANGVVGDGNGNPGNTLGGGGSGAFCDSSCGAKTGGTGAAGQVIITTGNFVELTFYDEQTLAIITSNVTVYLQGTNTTYNYTTSTGFVRAFVSDSDDTYTITYSAPNYNQRQYFYDINATSGTTLALYLRATAASSTVLITVTDQSLNVLVGAKVQVYVRNFSGGPDYIVEMCTTNINGQCVISADVSTNTYVANTTYRFFINYQNVIVGDSGYTKLTGNTLSLQSQTSSNPLQPYFNIPNIRFTPITYVGTLFSVTLTDIGNTPRYFCLYVERRVGATTTLLGSNCTTSAGITLTFNANSSIGDETYAWATVIIAGTENIEYKLGPGLSVPNNSAGTSYLVYSIVFIALCVGSVLMFGLGYYPEGALVAVVGFMILLFEIGSFLTKTMVIGLAIVALVVLIMIARRR